MLTLAKVDQLAISGVEWETLGIRSMRALWVHRKGASVMRDVDIVARFTAQLHQSDLCQTWFWSVPINSRQKQSKGERIHFGFSVHHSMEGIMECLIRSSW